MSIEQVMEGTPEFATGLRAHLQRVASFRSAAQVQRASGPGSEAAARPEAAPAEPTPEPVAAPVLVPPEQPSTEPRLLDERIRAFEAEVARFQQHERAVAEHERAVVERERAIGERERAIAERERELGERTAALARRAAERRPVREALREHAELSVGQLMQVFDDALTATHASGAPDYAVRLIAVRVLLGEAYAAEGDTAGASAAMDELAALRERRAADSV